MSTWFVLSNRREMGTVGAQAEKIKEKGLEEKRMLQRRPSFEGPFDGWSETAPEMKKAFEKALAKINTSESNVPRPREVGASPTTRPRHCVGGRRPAESPAPHRHDEASSPV